MEDPTCTLCDKPTEPIRVDESFNHEFGVEKIVYIESSCCQAPVKWNGRYMDEIDYKNYMDYTYGT